MIIDINSCKTREEKKAEALLAEEKRTEEEMARIYEETRQELRDNGFRRLNGAEPKNKDAALMVLAKMMLAGEAHRVREEQIKKKYEGKNKKRR